MNVFLLLSIKLVVLLGPVGIPITPPAPDAGAANSFPIQFDRFFGALLSIGTKIGLGIGAAVFLFMLVSALKERPVRWSAVISEGVGIVALIIMLLQSNAIITWIGNLI